MFFHNQFFTTCLTFFLLSAKIKNPQMDFPIFLIG